MVVAEVPPARPRRLTALVVACCAVLFSACRVDVVVDVAMDPDGSGTLTLTLTADAAVAADAGGLARDLRLDDLEAAGWETDGLVDTPDGGVRLVLTHDFRAPEELTALLASLNGTQGPFRSVAFRRDVQREQVVFTVSGAGQVVDGLASFADADLVALLGATPYADDVLAAGLAPSEAVSVSFTVALPGRVDATTGTRGDALVGWAIPLDGTAVDVATTSVWSRDAGGGWSYLATGLRVLFIAWIGLVVLAVVALAAARRRRRRLAPVLMGNHPTRRPGPRATVQVHRPPISGRDVPGRDGAGWDAGSDGDDGGGWDDGPGGWDDGPGDDGPPSPPRRPSFPLPDR